MGKWSGGVIKKIQKEDKSIFITPIRTKIDLDALNLLASDQIKYLCNCKYEYIEKRHNLIYQTYYTTLEERIKSGKLCYSDVCKLLGAVIELIECLKSRQMFLENIQINPNDIYFYNEEIRFIYLPLLQKRHMSSKEFCFKIIRILHVVDSKAEVLVKQIKKMSSYESIKDFLGNIIPKVEEKLQLQAENYPVESESETSLLNENYQGDTSESEGETTLLQQQTTAFFTDKLAECETTVLSDMAQPPNYEQTVPYHKEKYDLFLLRNSTGERIHINKSVFLIGKDLNAMDYILGSESVSRNHATIYLEEDNCYISDNGSTNGTTIEGIRLQQGERAELDDGFIVSLGREVFQVLMERKEL